MGALCACMAALFGTSPPVATNSDHPTPGFDYDWQNRVATLAVDYRDGEPSTYQGVVCDSFNTKTRHSFKMRYATGDPSADYRKALEFAREHHCEGKILQASSVSDFQRDLQRRVGLTLNLA